MFIIGNEVYDYEEIMGDIYLEDENMTEDIEIDYIDTYNMLSFIFQDKYSIKNMCY